MKLYTGMLILIFHQSLAQQNEVSITIDDVPNVYLNEQEGFKSILLERLDVMNIPVTIFINEKNIYNNRYKTENTNVLESWLKNKNITAGNHSFSHLNYADTTFEGFTRDIMEGEKITRELLGRRPAYFRFPFNSLGKDSMEHRAIKKFLKDSGYAHAPFTIESEDWAYNTLYEHALKNKDFNKAKQIGSRYLAHTRLLFEYFEKLSYDLHGRNIKHIYLCHDNALNTDYIEALIKDVRSRGYKFITLDKALEDDVYQSKEYYIGRYGFSWIYRWVKNETKRKTLMRNEPVDTVFQQEYDKFVNAK